MKLSSARTPLLILGAVLEVAGLAHLGNAALHTKNPNNLTNAQAKQYLNEAFEGGIEAMLGLVPLSWGFMIRPRKNETKNPHN